MDPIKNGDIPASYVSLPEVVTIGLSKTFHPITTRVHIAFPPRNSLGTCPGPIEALELLRSSPTLEFTGAQGIPVSSTRGIRFSPV